MIFIRWILGIVITLLCGGFLFLFMVSNGFRRSFGASENNPLAAILPLIAAAILCGGVVFPTQTILLHAGAVASLGLVGFCVWQLYYEAATVMWYGLFYLALWLFFYWRTVFCSRT